MGHDTTAYIGTTQPTDLRSAASLSELAEEIAEMEGNWGVYEALDAQRYDGKVSGIGLGRWFTRAQLREGVRRLWIEHRLLQARNREWDAVRRRWCRRRYSLKRGIRFLQTCLDRMPADHDAIYIYFG